MSASPHTTRPARFPAEAETVRALFREYATDIGVDLCFQGFERELADLPGAYADPTGALLLGLDPAAQPVACVAVRPLPAADSSHARICEMKRLYVRPSARGTGLGRRLVEQIVLEAQRLGYERMRLDTLATMTAALTLYRALGFVEIPPYYPNPIAGAVYMERVFGAPS